MELNEDIIPISYIGGTGGNLLCHLIVSAKRNIHDVIILSEHGNAHLHSLKDLPMPLGGINMPDSEKIEFMLMNLPDDSYEKPWYTIAHIKDINLIAQYFTKSIRITYDPDDVDDLSNIVFGKWYVDDVLSGNIASNRIHNKSSIRLSLLGWANKFKKENIPNVLFVSWKELFNGNINELITKLSIFTGINTNNFSIESLIYWRNKTQDGIDKFSNQQK